MSYSQNCTAGSQVDLGFQQVSKVTIFLKKVDISLGWGGTPYSEMRILSKEGDVLLNIQLRPQSPHLFALNSKPVDGTWAMEDLVNTEVRSHFPQSGKAQHQIKVVDDGDHYSISFDGYKIEYRKRIKKPMTRFRYISDVPGPFDQEIQLEADRK